MNPAVHRLAVVGHPIGHSRSPAMHTAALRELGLADQWSYEAIEIAPEVFAARVSELRSAGYRGLNVTIPHKEAALALADQASTAAREIGAANTLSFREGSILAENTDAPGLIASLPGPVEGKRALVLGAGGAGRGAAWALDRAGAQVEVWNRTSSRAEALAADIGVGVATSPIDPAAFEVIVNATSIGLPAPSGRKVAPTRSVSDSSSAPFPVDQLGESHLVVDLVYGEKPTELIKDASEQGATVVDGIEMLVQQGAASFRIWTGIEPPLDVMRRAAAGSFR